MIKSNATDEAFLHGTLQLDVAVLALHQGFEVELEPQRGGATADVALITPAGEILVEARVVGRGDASLDASHWANVFREQTLRYRFGGVAITGHISRTLNEQLITKLRDEIDWRARLIRAGGVTPPIVGEGVELSVVHESEARGSFEISIPGFDLWERLRRAFEEKRGSTTRSGAGWLRVDCTELLWERGLDAPSFPERVARLYAWVRGEIEAFRHLDGIVLSNAVWTITPSAEPEEVLSAPGVIGLRVPIDSFRTRETAIFARDSEDHGLMTWADMYRLEAAWLGCALAAKGLQPPPELAIGDGGAAA